MTCIYKFWFIIRNEFILCGSGDRINLSEIMGKKILFYHKNPLLKCDWLQNIIVFSEKKKFKQRLTDILRGISALEKKTDFIIKSYGHTKSEKIQLHQICKNWKETEPKVFLRYLLIGIDISSSSTHHGFVGIQNSLRLNCIETSLMAKCKGLTIWILFDLKIIILFCESGQSLPNILKLTKSGWGVNTLFQYISIAIKLRGKISNWLVYKLCVK